MDFTKRTNTLSRRKTLLETKTQHPIDCDITLPEYFPDVVRVLHCALTPRITGVQTAADRVTAEGSAVLRVLYVSEQGALRCFEQNIPFTQQAEGSVPPQAFAAATAETEYVNCRLQSPRRFDIHGSLCVSFTVYQKLEEPLLCACSGGGVQMRTDESGCAALLGCTQKLFRLSETLELGGAKPSIAQIIRCEAAALAEEIKPVNGKVLLKGELVLRTIYIADNESASVEQMEHSLPINQILEAEGAVDGCISDCSLRVSAIEIAAKTDAGGALRLLDTAITLQAGIALYAEQALTTVSDAYSTAYAIETQMQTVEPVSLCDRFSETYLCRGTLDISSLQIGQIADVYCLSVTQNTEMDKSTLHISGTMEIGILYRDREENWSFAQRNFPYNYNRTVHTEAQPLRCKPHLTVCGTGYNYSGDDSLEIRAELQISGLVFTGETKQVIADLTIDPDRPLCRRHASLTVYFAQAGESVWDIARRYGTTVSAVASQNALTDDRLTENCKLLIPRV